MERETSSSVHVIVPPIPPTDRKPVFLWNQKSKSPFNGDLLFSLQFISINRFFYLINK